MSLEERILDTPITWRLLEEDFHKAFRSSSKVGPNRSAVVFGENRGNTSVLVIARLDWTPNDESLPKTVVLKITTCEKLRQVGESNSQMQFEGQEKRAALMHNAEWNLYEKAQKCQEFCETMKLPKYYCGRNFDFEHLKAGYIAIEQITDSICFPAYETTSDEGAEQIVKIFAKLSAFSLKNPESVKSMHADVMDEILKMFVSKEKIEAGLDAVVAKFPDRRAQIETLKKLLPFYENYETLRDLMNYGL
ncbi:unnamed protein product, partial [Mesorhabditis belari]|uniref:Uncharacterized protein n=1 Tax=Mesorhabditis belari TaxID=2138241 RepID=A0AAF3FH66_9BILA